MAPCRKDIGQGRGYGAFADSPEHEVKLAVALALPAVIRGHALRQHKAAAAFQACARSAALAAQNKDTPSSWNLLCPEAPSPELAAGATVDLTAEELAGFAENLLLRNNLQVEAQVIGCCPHNAVLTGWTLDAPEACDLQARV